MNTENMSVGKFYIEHIETSEGVHLNNRLHHRSYSTEILIGNAQELEKWIEETEKPEFMIQVFNVENRGLDKFVHKEANRIIHNYVCGLSTYIDHCRNFMKEHYANTDFMERYEARVKTTFVESGLCTFVRQLRNYITHKDLPQSSMSLSGSNQPNVEWKSGISFDRDDFLNWDRWNSKSREYLSDLEEKISLSEIFLPHIQIMKDFEQWFVYEFEDYHKAAFDELSRLASEYEELKSKS